MAAHKVTFVSPAQIFSAVPFSIALTVPSRELLFFFLSCVKRILFLVNCLSLSPLRQLAPWPVDAGCARKRKPPMIDDFHFPAASQKRLGIVTSSEWRQGDNINRCCENKIPNHFSRKSPAHGVSACTRMTSRDLCAETEQVTIIVYRFLAAHLPPRLFPYTHLSLPPQRCSMLHVRNVKYLVAIF